MTAGTAKRTSEQSCASLRIEGAGSDEVALVLEGRLDATTTGRLWREAVAHLRGAPPRLIVEASGVTYCDTAGIAFLVDLRLRQERGGRAIEIRGLRPEFRPLLEMFPPGELVHEPHRAKPTSLPEEVGRASVAVWRDAVALIVFVGELLVALVYAIRHPRRLRWGDAFYVAETAGVNALPVVALISFLVGLIMAFQAAIPMQQFGAEVFVADLVSLSMLRELGPLMTAIMLAGRSGSAFAAELGTMKVREEIDALTTMGLDPVRFLVAPRVLAATAMTPLLTAFSDFVGLVGGAVVLWELGYPPALFVQRMVYSTTWSDFAGGLVKSIVFGLIVSGIGCMRGLQTKTGAAAVGESTTRAVVSSIILIVVADGVFSVVYFYLGV